MISIVIPVAKEGSELYDRILSFYKKFGVLATANGLPIS